MTQGKKSNICAWNELEDKKREKLIQELGGKHIKSLTFIYIGMSANKKNRFTEEHEERIDNEKNAKVRKISRFIYVVNEDTRCKGSGEVKIINIS